MSTPSKPQSRDERAAFPGHPFGGLVRDPGGSLTENGDPAEASDAAAPQSLPDDGGGFDLHLGVYAQF